MDFEAYLKIEYKLDTNSSEKLMRIFKRITTICFKNGQMSKDLFCDHKLKKVKKDRGYLTKMELEKIIDFKPNSKRLEKVRDIFLFCCYTGLAYADVYSLTTKEIVTGKEGKQWIVKARTKTHSLCNIPLLNPAIQILERYADFAKAEGRLLPVPANQTMNDGLKEIAELCGINKQLTTHCARHTFATTVTLANNVSIENVSQMLGHSNIKMTQHYAKVLNTSISRDMEKVEAELSL